MKIKSNIIIFKKVSFVFLIFCLCYTNYIHASSIEFNQEQLTLIKKQNMGKQWLMLLWSVDCPPCFKELAIIQKLQNKDNNLAVVIINTDANNDITKERIEIIAKFKLSSVSNFHFIEGENEQSRYIIDSNWYGELPRSYFVDRKGKFHGKSGLVKSTTIGQWLTQ